MPVPGLMVDVALLALTVAALGFVLAGLVLSLDPGRFGDPERNAGRWLLEPLESPRHVERFLYRHHRWFGLLVVAGTTYSLWRILGTGLLWPPEPLDLRMALLWLLAAACGLALLIGIVITLRPSGLKPVEARANQWIGWRDSALQRWFHRHPRARGVVILLISSYALLVFGLLLLERVHRWSGQIH